MNTNVSHVFGKRYVLKVIIDDIEIPNEFDLYIRSIVRHLNLIPLSEL